MPERLDLRTIGGASAILGTAIFVLGVLIVALTGGPDTVIPETGSGLVRWIGDVRDDRTGFEIGTGFVVLGGVFGVVALLGFFDMLRGAGPALVLAPVLGIIGLAFVTVSHALPIVLAAELVPDYAAARVELQTTGDVVAATALATNYIGDVLLWGVAVPLFALAVLRTRTFPRWIGWLGIFVGAFGGWIGALGPVSSVLEGISSLGFLAFFVWMPAMGVQLLRGDRGRSEAAATPPDAVPQA